MKFMNTQAWKKSGTNKKLQVWRKKVQTKSAQARKVAAQGIARLEAPLKRAPMLSFIGMLGILLLIIAAVSAFHAPAEEITQTEVTPKTVETFSIGEAPRVQANGKVEKSGVITIVAQAPGVIGKINVKPGQNVLRGQTLLSMNSNYSGGNLLALQAQLSQKQLENFENTYDQQKDLIAKQKSLAEKQEASADDLREISRNSLGTSKDLLKLNEEILGGLDLVLATSTDSAEIAQTKQLKTQILSGVAQLRAQIAQTEYQANDENPPADMARLQRDMTKKQLEIQEKSLDLNREVLQLQNKIARVQLASMYPSAPLTARVERVHVNVGDFVQPGTPLITIDCDTAATQIIATVPAGIAERVSMLEPSTIRMGDEIIELTPDYVSREATDGQLYSVQFTLPQEATPWLTDNSFVTVSLALGQADTSASVPFIPLDAVHQNELVATVYVLENNQVIAQEVKLGAVQGRFVSIVDGLHSGNQVILDRTVVAGEPATRLE